MIGGLLMQVIANGQTKIATGLELKAGFDLISLEIISKAQAFPPHTQLSLAIITNDSTNHYGCIWDGQEFTLIQNQDSVFEIGSITKVFTSTLLAHAVIDGKMTLDQPIQTYFPFDLSVGKEITARHLANHTSGLPRVPANFMASMVKNPDNPYKEYGEKELLSYLKNQLTLEKEPGTISSYSNLGMGLLGHLIGKRYGQSYESLLQEKICQPLQMNLTTTLYKSIGKSLVLGQNRNGKRTSNWDFSVLAGAGAIRAPVSDLLKFVQFSFEPNGVNAMIQSETVKVDETIGVALGWHTYHLDQRAWIWHNGGTGGYRSCMALDPSRRKAVVLLSNVSAFHSKADEIDAIVFELAKKMN